MEYSIESVNNGIDRMIDEIQKLQEVNEIVNKAYQNLCNAVDKMFYNIDTQWEDGMYIEYLVGDLRKLMYGEVEG